jgi:hypothetical protein
MTEFNKSQWAKPEFTQEYRDGADVYIVERKRLLEILKSFYKHFIGLYSLYGYCVFIFMEYCRWLCAVRF